MISVWGGRGAGVRLLLEVLFLRLSLLPLLLHVALLLLMGAGTLRCAEQ